MLTRRRWTLLLAVALLAAACNGGRDVGAGDREPPRGVKRGTLRVLNHGDVDALDPGYGYAAVDWALLRGLVRELYSFDSRLQGEKAMTPVPDLADGPYRLSPDGRTYTFRLRKGVRYAPPVSSEVRAEDFIYAVERQLDPRHPRSPNPYSSLIEGTAEFAAGKARTIKGMQAPDDQTLRITLKQPASDFPSILTLPFFSPVPRDYAARFKPGTDYAQHLVGSGPYTVSSYDPGRRLELERNQNWDPRTDPLRKAWVDKITVTIGPEAGIQQAIERGEQDLNLDNIPPPNADLQRLSGDRALSERLAVETTGCVHYLTLQMDSGATRERKVRQAINYAIDRQAVVGAIGGRYAGEPASTILSPTLAGYSAFDLYPSQDSRGDPDAAKRLLAEAGYRNGVRLTYVGQSSAQWKALYDALEASLARADIRLKPKFFKTLQVYKRALRLQSKKGEHQLGAARWCPDYPGNGSRSFIGVLLDGRKITPTANNNYGNYNNPKVNAMIDRAYATRGDAARNAIWGQIDRLVMQDAAWAPLVYDREAFFWATRVRNWTYTPWLNNPDITNLWLDPNTP
ncbi:MAG: ABC transporter substrate-binding protein [Actinomycetes bacterium]